MKVMFNTKWREIACAARSLPKKLLGPDAIIHTRRPFAWNALSEAEAAILDFLRSRCETSELGPTQTTARLLQLLSGSSRFEHLLKAARPNPRVSGQCWAPLASSLEKTPRNFVRSKRDSILFLVLILVGY